MFTDEDLKRLKDLHEKAMPDILMAFYEHTTTPEKFMAVDTFNRTLLAKYDALLARLEAAEKAVLHHGHASCGCNKDWRKAVGR